VPFEYVAPLGGDRRHFADQQFDAEGGGGVGVERQSVAPAEFGQPVAG